MKRPDPALSTLVTAAMSAAKNLHPYAVAFRAAMGDPYHDNLVSWVQLAPHGIEDQAREVVATSLAERYGHEVEVWREYLAQTLAADTPLHDAETAVAESGVQEPAQAPTEAATATVAQPQAHVEPTPQERATVAALYAHARELILGMHGSQASIPRRLAGLGLTTSTATVSRLVHLTPEVLTRYRHGAALPSHTPAVSTVRELVPALERLKAEDDTRAAVPAPDPDPAASRAAGTKSVSNEPRPGASAAEHARVAKMTQERRAPAARKPTTTKARRAAVLDLLVGKPRHQATVSEIAARLGISAGATVTLLQDMDELKFVGSKTYALRG